MNLRRRMMLFQDLQPTLPTPSLTEAVRNCILTVAQCLDVAMIGWFLQVGISAQAEYVQYPATAYYRYSIAELLLPGLAAVIFH